MEVTSVLDRALFEHLFHVGWRRAIDLMHNFGAYQTGQALLIDRAELIRQLEALEAGTEFAIEQGRKQRLLDSLEKVRRHRAAARVILPVAGDANLRTMADLPPGVHLQPGSLKVEFGEAEDLLGKLFELAQAAAHDFDGFRSMVSGVRDACAIRRAAATTVPGPGRMNA
jgi:hypothetical protein